MKKEITISYDIMSIEDLTSEENELVKRAMSITQKAYAPYSKFKVGASVLLDDGTIIAGNNQENMAYPSGLCAERVALFYASSNHPESVIKTIAVFAESDDFDFQEIVKPCGACRQVMSEYEIKQNETIRVLLCNRSEVIVISRAIDLLPFLFNAKGLKG